MHELCSVAPTGHEVLHIHQQPIASLLRIGIQYPSSHPSPAATCRMGSNEAIHSPTLISPSTSKARLLHVIQLALSPGSLGHLMTLDKLDSSSYRSCGAGTTCLQLGRVLTPSTVRFLVRQWTYTRNRQLSWAPGSMTSCLWLTLHLQLAKSGRHTAFARVEQARVLPSAWLSSSS